MKIFKVTLNVKYTPAAVTRRFASNQWKLSRSQRTNVNIYVDPLDEGENLRSSLFARLEIFSMLQINLINLINFFKEYNYHGNNQQPPHYRHSQLDLTNEWEEGHQNGNHQQNRRGMTNGGGSQDDRREQFYQYRNGNVSREDFGEELRRGRSEVTVISNAVLNHLTSQQRRPTNRVRKEFLNV